MLGATGYYRLRIGGYRAIFERCDQIEILIVERVGPRGDVYKRQGAIVSRVQFIDDHEGNPAFVVVPIQLWKAWGLNDADLSNTDLLEKALLEGAQDEARSKIAPVLRVDPDMLVPWK